MQIGIFGSTIVENGLLASLSAFSASIDGLTTNPTFGATAQIGVELTGTISGLVGGETVVHGWTLDGAPISGATGATYTPVAGDNLGVIRYAPTVDDVPVISAGFTARHAPPTQNAEPLITGQAVIGESLAGTAGTFNGSGLTIGNQWEISADGATGWTGTGDTDLTGPAMAADQYYRLASTATNSGGSLTTYSNAIGPAVAPVIEITGLIEGQAVEGDHAFIAMVSDIGTITARRWHEAGQGSEYGTGVNPTDFSGGTTLYATATIGGVDYTVSAPIQELTETIVATMTPAMSPLYAGQAVQDVTGYATMVAIGNFTAMQGRTIVSAVVAFTGAAVSAGGALAEDDLAGFTVTVTDSENYVQVFPASQITVQYKVQVNATAGNEADIQINPLVPDAEPLSITISAGPYAGTYNTLTAGDLRGGPVNFPGTITISGTTGLGDTLTVDLGLWGTTTGSLTFSSQWQSDDVDISGATAATFDITASEQGTDVTVEVTADDGANPTVTAESAAISIPGGAATLTLTQIGAVYSNTAANSIVAFNQPVDFGAAKANKIGIAVIAFGQAFGGTGVSVDIDGGSALTPVANTAQNPAIQAGSVIFVFDASAGGTHTINGTPQGGAWRGWQMKVYSAEKSDDSAPVVVGDGTSQSGSALMDLSQTVAVGDEILAAIMSGDYTAQSPITLVGLTRDGGVQYSNSGSKEAWFLEATAAVAGSLPLTADPAGGSAPISFSLVKVS